MKRYEISKIPYDPNWIHNPEHILVKKSELDQYIKKGWSFEREYFFIITPFLDWWKPLSDGNKITLFGIILTAFLTLFLWSLSEYFQYKKSNLKTENSLLIKRFDSLKKSNDSLNLNFELLNQRFHTLTDSLNQKNKIIENLKLEIKPKRTSGKK
jgi:hypothetical protein